MSEEVKQTRLVSLDVFRGMTIAGMVLVNNPGTWGAIYSPLKHAEWHGITPTDYIFPFFLFIVGIAIPIALGKRVEQGITREVYWKIFSRALMIFGIGLFMAAFPLINLSESTFPFLAKIVLMFSLLATTYFWLTDNKKLTIILGIFSILFPLTLSLLGFSFDLINFGTLRIPGVLQRIAVCYAIVSIIFLHTNWKQQTLIGVILLFIYWILMTVIPVPGCEITTIDDKACNLAAYLDRLILTENHIWKSAKVFDPEGILSTIPAIVTTISGVLTGTWLKSKRDDLEKVSGLLFFGVILTAIGYCWNFFFPYNKSLWTSSYVVYTSGLALCFLGACYWLIDIKKYRKWAKPFVVFGVNALALFIFSGLLARILGLIKVSSSDGKEIALQKWIFDNIFLAIASPINASLLYAVVFILFWLFLMWLLYRRRLFIKL